MVLQFRPKFRRKLSKKWFLASFFIIYTFLSLLTQHLSPKLIIRDVGYLTRPIWDSPGAQPQIVIPHFHSPSLNYSAQCELHGWKPRSNLGQGQASKIKVVDAVIFSIELDILELRLRELWDVVDIFLVMEGSRTFTGRPKPFVLQNNLKRFEWAEEKLLVITLDKELEEWPKKEFDNEVQMRKNMTVALQRLNLNFGDLIIVGDVDEIPRKETIGLLKACQGFPEELHLQMKNYIYSFEFETGETNWKPHVVQYNFAFRYHHGKRNSNHKLADSGWHCSFCFRHISDFIFKMTSYSHNDRVTGQHLLQKENIQKKICEGADIFDMFPEAYSYPEFFAKLGKLPRKLSTFDLPSIVVEEYEKFKFLLPGGCIREDHD